VNLRVVLGDGVGNGLEHQGLTGLWRRNDQTALALTDWRHEVDDSGGELVWLGLETQAALWVKRGELAELNACLSLLNGETVYAVNAHDCVELLATLALAVTWLADCSNYCVTLAQAVLLDLVERYVDVVWSRQVAGGTNEGVVVENVEDTAYWNEYIVRRDLWLGLICAALATATTVTVAVTVALAVALTPAAALVVEVTVVVAVLAVAVAVATLGTLLAVSAIVVAVVAVAIVLTLAALAALTVVVTVAVAVTVAVVAPLTVATLALLTLSTLGAALALARFALWCSLALWSAPSAFGRRVRFGAAAASPVAAAGAEVVLASGAAAAEDARRRGRAAGCSFWISSMILWILSFGVLRRPRIDWDFSPVDAVVAIGYVPTGKCKAPQKLLRKNLL
jgi:hypothetical protein